MQDLVDMEKYVQVVKADKGTRAARELRQHKMMAKFRIFTENQFQVAFFSVVKLASCRLLVSTLVLKSSVCCFRQMHVMLGLNKIKQTCIFACLMSKVSKLKLI